MHKSKAKKNPKLRNGIWDVLNSFEKLHFHQPVFHRNFIFDNIF